jgi:hypothetical protein
MGAPRAFDHRAAELAAERRSADDDAVVDSFLTDVSRSGALFRYLSACQLAYRSGATLFVHGGVTERNFGAVPGRDRVAHVDAWVDGLNGFYAEQLAMYAAGRRPDALIAYQAPHPGTHDNPDSVVYARPADEDGNPLLPPSSVIARLRDDGIDRVVVGHTPSGDCPAIVRDGDFELVLADNSYSRLERGSRVAVTDATTQVSGETVLDGGEHRAVRVDGPRRRDSSPLGLRDRASGRLVKAQLDGSGYLSFRGLPQHEVEQRAATADEVARWQLVVPR